MSNLPEIALMQEQSDFLFDTKTKFVGLMGSYRSGKTFVACVKAIYLASLNIGYDGLMLEPTHPLLVSVLVPTMEEVLAELNWKEYPPQKGQPPHCWYECMRSQSNPHFILHFLAGDVVIHLRSSENWNRIRGFSIAWFIADEFDTSGAELCSQAWQKMVARLTSGNFIQGNITSTKEGFQWAYDFFVTNGHKQDRRMIDINVANNPFIDDGYVDMMRDQLTPKQFEAYILNQFVNYTSGNVYYSYDRVLNHTDMTLDSFHFSYPISVGIDFNVGKMATEISVITNDGKTFFVDELYGAQNTEALIKVLQMRFPNRIINCYPDASGDSSKSNASTSDIALLRNAGFHVFNKTKNPNVRDRVAAFNARLCNANGVRNVFVNEQRCPRLARSLEQQCYINGTPDKSNDLDHPVDAAGYTIHYRFPIHTHGSSQIRVAA